MDGTGSWRYWSMPHLGFGSTGRALTLTLTRGYQQQQLAHVVETDEHAHQLQEDLPHLSAPCAPPAFLLLLGGEGTEDLPIDHEAHGCAEDEVCDPEDHHIQGLRTLRGPPRWWGSPDCEPLIGGSPAGESGLLRRAQRSHLAATEEIETLLQFVCRVGAVPAGGRARSGWDRPRTIAPAIG